MTLQVLAGILFFLLAAGGVVVFVAWLDGTSLRDIPHWVLAIVFAVAAAIPLLISFLFLLGRIVQRRRAKRLGITAGKDACSYEDSHQVTWDPAIAQERCLAALRSLPQGCKIESSDVRVIVAKTGETARSFGEILRIAIEPLPHGGCALRVQSRPSVMQLFDAGINADNVVRIMGHLKYGLSEARPDEPLEAEADEDAALSAWEWVALAVLVAVGAYTGLLILLLHRWPAILDIWASILVDLALSPTQWLGIDCMTEESALGHLLIQQLNVLILPLVLIYALYHCAQFRSKRERMSGTDWILCIGSLGALPFLVALGCELGWEEGMTGRYRGLISLMTQKSAGAAFYAVGLVVFCNGVSYLPGLALARLTGPRLPNPNR